MCNTFLEVATLSATTNYLINQPNLFGILNTSILLKYYLNILEFEFP